MASIFKRGGKSNRKGVYVIEYFDHTGRRRRKSSGTTDKATAERIAAKLEAEVALRKEGVIDVSAESIARESRRSVAEHIEAFEAKLRAAGRTSQYIRETIGYLTTIFGAAGYQTISDISADGVTRYLGTLRKTGKSSRTIQAHVTAVKSFTKWLVQLQKLHRDPLLSIRRPNPEGDRRKKRSMLRPEEWPVLEQYLQGAGQYRFGLTNTQRRLLYLTAIQTGLRSSELRSLVIADLNLTCDQPFIVCQAEDTKNEKNAKQYIQPSLAQSLAGLVAGRHAQDRVFEMPHESNLARMLRGDLGHARQSWLQAAASGAAESAVHEASDFLLALRHNGDRIDFHSLRHSCGAWLVLAGVPVKVVQAIMRHSNISLTLDTYGHLQPGAEADAVHQLGEWLPKLHPAESGQVSADCQQICQHSGRDVLPLVATQNISAGDSQSTVDQSKSLSEQDLREEVRQNATPCENAPSWARTMNLLIKRNAARCENPRKRAPPASNYSVSEPIFHPRRVPRRVPEDRGGLNSCQL